MSMISKVSEHLCFLPDTAILIAQENWKLKQEMAGTRIDQPHTRWKLIAMSAKCRKIKNLTPQCWTSSALLMLSLHSPDAIPHMYWCYPPQYWTASAVLNRRYTGCLSQSWISADPLKSYRLTKKLDFSVVIFKAYLKKIASISPPQTVN